MSTRTYDLKYHDENGNYLFSFDTPLSFTYERTKNDIGTAEIVLPAELYSQEDFQCDYILEIHRENEDTGDLEFVTETAWFLRSAEFELDDECRENVTLTFLDNISLIDRRAIPWYSENIGDYPSHYLLPSDDIIKLIAYHNWGAGTTTPVTNHPNGPFLNAPPPPAQVLTAYGGDLTLRRFDILIEGYELLASAVESKHDWISALAAMKNVAKLAKNAGDNLWFDIVYIPSTNNILSSYQLNTWVGKRGQDKTASVFVGPEYGNMINATYTLDWSNEATVVFLAGAGQGAARTIGQAQNLDATASKPFYPIETVISNTEIDFQNAADSAAQIELQGRGVQRAVSGTLLSTFPTRLFEDVQYGDVVTVDWRDVAFPAEISSFKVEVTSDGEKITMPLNLLEEPFN